MLPRRKTPLPRSIRTPTLPKHLRLHLQSTRGANDEAVAGSITSLTPTIQIAQQSKFRAMLNQSRKSVRALEDSTKATRRSTVASLKATAALRELMAESNEASPQNAKALKGASKADQPQKPDERAGENV
jgi:Mg2+ and Co2+ transporter CorA